MLLIQRVFDYPNHGQTDTSIGTAQTDTQLVLISVS